MSGKEVAMKVPVQFIVRLLSGTKDYYYRD